MPCEINPHILKYIEAVENEKIPACKDQHQLVAHIRKCFEEDDIYVNETQLERYLSQVKYFPFERLYPWEEFLLALHDCTYWTETNLPRWQTLLCLVARGAGKDGFMAFESWCSISPYNGIKQYDVDICANNEEQAMTPVNDLLDVLENPKHIKKMRKHFYWNKEKIVGLATRSTIKGRTNSPKGKDGLRSGKVNFNEIHQYQNYDNINVFTTGLGKKDNPRRAFFTTQGDVRDGPLDDLLTTAHEILDGGEPDNGFLPFICRLDDREEVHDEKNWPKANPSLPYKPNLMAETRQEYREWKQNPERLPAFMTKRMNIPEGRNDIRVTDYEKVKWTNKPLPDLSGWECVVGVDFAKVSDFASVVFHFKKGDARFDVHHSWLCKKSKDLERIKAPWKEWAKRDLLTVVDDVEIHPDLICQYIASNGWKYNILGLAVDNYRYGFLSYYLRKIGFDADDRKNVILVRPSDIMKVVPVIDSCFNNNYYTWGDDPVMRWAVNNTKLVRSSRSIGSDTGNFYYAKIEARSRKTDPFFAHVAAMTIEDKIGNSSVIPAQTIKNIPILTF